MLKFTICLFVIYSCVFTSAFASDDDDFQSQQRTLTQQQRAIMQAGAIAEARIAFNDGLRSFFLDPNISDDDKLKVAMPRKPDLSRYLKKEEEKILKRMSDNPEFMKRCFDKLSISAEDDISLYRNLISAFSTDGNIAYQDQFNVAVRAIWLESEKRSSSYGSFHGEFFERDACETIFELLEPFIANNQKLFFRYFECAYVEGAYVPRLKKESLIRDVGRLDDRKKTAYSKVNRADLCVQVLISKIEQLGQEMLALLGGHVRDDFFHKLFDYRCSVEELERLASSVSIVEPSLTQAPQWHRSSVAATLLKSTELKVGLRDIKNQAVVSEYNKVVIEDKVTAEEKSTDQEYEEESKLLDAQKKSPSESDAPKNAQVVSMANIMQRSKAVSRFDFTVTPEWIERLVVDRLSIKYTEMLPFLKKLGTIKNNSGSQRMFTFHQTPNGKPTVIFYHEPHPDDGRDMRDPCYVKPLVNGFERAGYAW